MAAASGQTGVRAWGGRLGAVVAVTLGLSLVGLLIWSLLGVPPSGRAVRSPSVRERPGGWLGRLVGAGVARHIRGRAEAARLRTSLTDAQVLARFLDHTTPLATRRLDAWRLAARIRTPAAKAALRQALLSGPPALRAVVAEALGHSDWPEAREWLLALLTAPETEVVRGAIRGLALIGDDEVVARLGDLLGSAAAEGVRVEAATRLGEVDSEAAFDALIAGLEVVPEGEVSEAVVQSLGRFPFARTEPAFREMVFGSEYGVETRVNAVEALTESSAAAAPFLFEVAALHADPAIRESAAWALGLNRGTGEWAEGLLELAAAEPDVDVRRRLYESLVNQVDVAADRLLPMVVGEADPDARVAGANAVAAALAGGGTSEASRQRFDAVLVPELLRIAQSGGTLNMRLRAVFALRRAGTAASRAALAVLAGVADPRVAAAAAHGLP